MHTPTVLGIGISSRTCEEQKHVVAAYKSFSRICGTAQMDAAVLVIAATDGVMAQTKEHLQLARQIGVQKIIVFVNKADLVEKDDLELVEIEARELLSENGFDGKTASRALRVTLESVRFRRQRARDIRLCIGSAGGRRRQLRSRTYSRT